MMRFTFLLSVPGMLEYESIPGVSSSKPFGGRTKSHADVTVKTITHKVNVFHDVLMFNAVFLLQLSAFRLISFKFVFQLTNVLAILNAHCVDPEIIKQVFRQV